jgi:uncharacterized RDD family membrane protein YckC
MEESTSLSGSDVNPPSNAAEQNAGLPATASGTGELPARRPSLSELALGGVLIVGDTMGARLEVPQGVDVPASPTLDTVLRPAAEWDTAPPAPLTAARHVTVGILSDVRKGAVWSGRFLYDTTDTVGRSLEQVTRPIRRSRIMKPVRVRFHRYQERGEQQLARWQTQGRSEEVRSRAVAEASLGVFVQRSVSDLTESEQIQVLVQQIVASQSTGMFEKLVEEVRERMVSLDIVLDRRIRRSAVTELPPRPPFYSAYIRERPILAAISSVDRTLAGHYAGFVSRLAAFMIDLTLLLIALTLATSFFNALVGLFNLDALLGRFMGAAGFTGTIMAAIAGLSGILLVSAYIVIGWSINGQTVGNLLLGIRVVGHEGGRVSFSRAVLRLLGAYISGFLLFIGFLWALFDGRRQGWHDKLAGTVVVYDWPAIPDEQFLRIELDVSGVPSRSEPTL